MITEFKLPELGENITAADITKILVKPGDAVEPDQSVIELETDKATVEVPAEMKGIVKEVFVKEGEKVKIGSVIFTVETGGASAEKKAAAPAAEEKKAEVPKTEAPRAETPTEEPAPAVASTGKKEFVLPALGENIASADIIKLLIKPGDNVEVNQTVI